MDGGGVGSRRKNDALKLALAARLMPAFAAPLGLRPRRRAFAAPQRLRPRRRETRRTVEWIARRLILGTRKSAVATLPRWTQGTHERGVRRAKTMA